MNINKNLNYYNILGVEKNATSKQLKVAYYELSKIYHPDVSKEKNAEVIFKYVVEAYKILTNSEQRAEYDKISEHGANYVRKTENYDFDFKNDNVVYDSYKKQYEKHKNEELIDILLVYKDIPKFVEYNRLIPCKECDGTGNDLNADVFECDMCDGSGKYQGEKCGMCKGAGRVGMLKCKSCSGNRRITKQEKIKVDAKKFVDGKLKVDYMGNYSKIDPGKIGKLLIMIKKGE